MRNLSEKINIYDKKGHLLITPDLKVRHKKSGFEYTVKNVMRSGGNGELRIILGPPEMPRIAVKKDEFSSQNPLVKKPQRKKSGVLHEIDSEEIYIKINEDNSKSLKPELKFALKNLIDQLSDLVGVEPDKKVYVDSKEDELKKDDQFQKNMQLKNGEFLVVNEKEFEKDYELR